ncbi:MAG: RecX family transcriptional regulator [Rikenellaceae bacterium]|nr:RecX family transcriptional regulator [Rikenellaceae bacterium]
MADGKKYEDRTHAKKPKSASEALASLMRLCSRSEKSSGDAMRLMAGWGVPEAERAAVVKKLTESRFIDDRRFAQAYIRDKIDFSGWGPYKIERGLTAKGISREIISEVSVLISGSGSKAKSGRLESLIGKKAVRTKYKDPYDLKGKLLRYAAGLGYPYEEVLEAIERVVSNIKETEK